MREPPCAYDLASDYTRTAALPMVHNARLSREADVSEPIYLDYNATTPVAPEVLEAMTPALRDLWGNPSSAHIFGRRAAEAIDLARSEVAALLGAHDDEIVFTSGGTESNNAAIVGAAEAQASRGRHLVTSCIEHPAVEQACRHLETRGWSVDRAPVDRNGRVDAETIAGLIRDQTTLLTIMHANNETGVVQPIEQISTLARARSITLHTDAAQSVGKIAVNVETLGIDLLTLAGHKLYAPKGIGVLYVRRGTSLTRFLHGAGHEGGRRAGTENTAQIVGLGRACRLATEELEERGRRYHALCRSLRDGLAAGLPEIVVHAEQSERLPNTLSVAIPGIDAARLIEQLEEVATAAGAACHAGVTEPSRVLLAMGIDPATALATLRLTVGRETTQPQIERAVAEICSRALEMIRSGGGDS